MRWHDDIFDTISICKHVYTEKCELKANTDDMHVPRLQAERRFKLMKTSGAPLQVDYAKRTCACNLKYSMIMFAHTKDIRMRTCMYFFTQQRSKNLLNYTKHSVAPQKLPSRAHGNKMTSTRCNGRCVDCARSGRQRGSKSRLDEACRLQRCPRWQKSVSQQHRRHNASNKKSPACWNTASSHNSRHDDHKGEGQTVVLAATRSDASSYLVVLLKIGLLKIGLLKIGLPWC